MNDRGWPGEVWRLDPAIERELEEVTRLSFHCGSQQARPLAATTVRPQQRRRTYEIDIWLSLRPPEDVPDAAGTQLDLGRE